MVRKFVIHDKVNPSSSAHNTHNKTVTSLAHPRPSHHLVSDYLKVCKNSIVWRMSVSPSWLKECILCVHFLSWHWVVTKLILSFGQFPDPQAGEYNWWRAHHTLPIQDHLGLHMCLGHFRKHALRHRSNGWFYGQTVSHTLPTPTSSACITERLKRGRPRTQVKNAFCVCSFCPEHLSANYSPCECFKF